eukprot:scaffold3035_cov111-Isochrysis_galbana.AAC.6
MTLPSASRSVRKSVYKCGVSADHGKSAVSATRRVARATPPRFSPAVRMGTRTAADATPLSFLSHQAVVAPGETGGDAGPHDGDAGTSGHSGASAAPPVGEESSAGDLPPGLASPPAPGRAQPEISSAEQLAGRWRAASSGSRRRGGELARRAAPLAGEPLTKLAGKGAPAPAPGGCSLSANGGASRRGSFENWPLQLHAHQPRALLGGGGGGSVEPASTGAAVGRGIAELYLDLNRTPRKGSAALISAWARVTGSGGDDRLRAKVVSLLGGAGLERGADCKIAHAHVRTLLHSDVAGYARQPPHVLVLEIGAVAPAVAGVGDSVSGRGATEAEIPAACAGGARPKQRDRRLVGRCRQARAASLVGRRRPADAR